MARIAAVFAALCMTWTVVHAQDEGLTPGVISASNVEVTADSGEVLDLRLDIGDQVFVVTNPKSKKAGWYRISKTPNDTVGIGWVESRFVRTFRRWQAPQEENKPSDAPPVDEKTVFAFDVEPMKSNQVGVLPFLSSDNGDSVTKKAQEIFLSSVRSSGKLEVVVDPLKEEVVDLEDPQSVQAVISKHNLDGLFTGNVSNQGKDRLLQIRYYGKGREGAVLEKVKTIPKGGNVKEIVDSLAVTCVAAISGK